MQTCWFARAHVKDQQATLSHPDADQNAGLVLWIAYLRKCMSLHACLCVRAQIEGQRAALARADAERNAMSKVERIKMDQV